MAQEKFSSDFQNSTHVNPTVKRVIAGFWTRVIACFIDTLLLGVIGYLLTFTFFDFFLSLGIWSRLIGFAIACAYFCLFNSIKGNGQTIGKRWMNIKVINAVGELISLRQSFLRYAIFAVAFLLNTVFTYKITLLGSPVGVVINLLSTVIGGSIIWLYIFDRATRRSLHDLIAGTYVVRCSNVYPPLTKGIKKVHIIVISVWTLIVIISSTSIGYLFSSQENPTLPKLLAICQSIENTGKGYRCSSIMESVSFGSNSQGKTLEVGVISSQKITASETQAASAEIASIIFKEYPDVTNDEVISIILKNTVDMWIFSSGQYAGTSHTVAEWKKIMEEKNGLQI